MKVFISWSGDTSRAVAEGLRDWLPSVIQTVKPFLSSADIDKGARWSAEIAEHLGDTKAGIICLTPDNLHSQWIHFEAGALSKTVEKTLVCPYLLHLEPTDVEWPLAQFQATRAQKEETRGLVRSINKALGDNALAEGQLDKTFDRWWPDLDAVLQKAYPGVEQNKREVRSDREISKEILELVREIAKVRIVSRPSIPEATAAVQRLMNEGLPWGDIVIELARQGVPALWSAETLAKIAQWQFEGRKLASTSQYEGEGESTR